MSSYSTKLLDSIRSTLYLFDDKYISNGEPLFTNIQHALNEYDEELISAITSNELLRRTFTIDTGKALIFKTQDFLASLRPNDTDYWKNSYTKYKTKIGLTINNNQITENPDVVLDFPYKDAVLEAGMTKEDQTNSNEIFYNTIIARAEIDELEEPKVLVNNKKFSEKNLNGQEINSFEDENLVLKGNNLIGLSSISKKYKKRFKMIYLDPPYNTTNKDFPYNDSFTHSTWLSFMNTRLQLAKEMLADDGAIFVSIDDKECAYLKVLMDGIFKRKNFLTQFNIQVRYVDKSLAEAKAFKPVTEYTLMYAKDSHKFKPNQPTEEYTDKKFTYEINELSSGTDAIINGEKVKIFKKGEWSISKKEPNRNLLKETWISGSIYSKMSYGQLYQKVIEPRLSVDGNGALYKIYGHGDDGLGYRYYVNPKKSNATRGKMYSGMPLDRVEEIKKGKSVKKLPITNNLDYAAEFGNIRHEGGVSLNSGKKPEKLLKGFMDIATHEGDWVLDFFGGSGTTASVALKSNRKFVTLEQIDSQVNKILTRLNNVISGEQTGISKDVDWNGGGKFIYSELAQQNAYFKNKIDMSQSENELISIQHELVEHATLNFKLIVAEIDTDSDDWKKMKFSQQKKVLSDMLDLNQMYINYSDIDNNDVNKSISEDSKLFSRSFYGENE